MKLLNNKYLKGLILFNSLFIFFIAIFIIVFNPFWNQLDNIAVDSYLNFAIRNGHGIPVSSKIVNIVISDKTYQYLNSNTLNKEKLAELNNLLSNFSAKHVIYDIIFARKDNMMLDSVFAESITAKNTLFYLPIAFDYSPDPSKFRWENSSFLTKLENGFLTRIITTDGGKPYYARSAIVQNEIISDKIQHTGHISLGADDDATYRNYPVFIKVDSLYFPSVVLSAYCNYVNVPVDSVIIKWGYHIIIPKTKDSYLQKDIKIPIDEKGELYIPYPSLWKQSYKIFEMSTILEKFAENNFSYELSHFLEGNFIIISDISSGIADLGNTPLEKRVPLATTHYSFLNSLLNNQFYKETGKTTNLLLSILILIIVAFFYLIRNRIVLGIVFILFTINIVVFTYYAFAHLYITPVSSLIFIAVLGTVMNGIYDQYRKMKEISFIKSAFTKYLTPEVVSQIIEDPNLLQLGGEERNITILFSDIENFTSLANKLQVKDLVSFLNEYLTALSGCVLENKGIVDKYIGDAILCEFGVPIYFPNHAEQAIVSAIKMQEVHEKFKQEWIGKLSFDLKMRIGINTGNAIVGNMGSKQLFDYTAIGLVVNITERIEKANKYYKTKILISDNTFKQLPTEKFLIRIVDKIKVKGISNPISLYEVCGYIDNSSQEDKHLFNLYNQAYNLYLERNFADSLKIFNEINITFNDSATNILINRINTIASQELPKAWDGSIDFFNN